MQFERTTSFILRAQKQFVVRQLFVFAPFSTAFSTFSARFSALSGDSINFTTVKAGIRRSFPVCWQIRSRSLQPDDAHFIYHTKILRSVLLS